VLNLTHVTRNKNKQELQAVSLHRTPREAKALYPSDWMRKLNSGETKH